MNRLLRDEALLLLEGRRRNSGRRPGSYRHSAPSGPGWGNRGRGGRRTPWLCSHDITTNQIRIVPREFVEIDDVQAVSLPDLIAMKLSSGTRNLLRAIDLADVIGLIRARRLTPAFAAKLPRSLRPDFRKLARAVTERSASEDRSA